MKKTTLLFAAAAAAMMAATASAAPINASNIDLGAWKPITSAMYDGKQPPAVIDTDLGAGKKTSLKLNLAANDAPMKPEGLTAGKTTLKLDLAANDAPPLGKMPADSREKALAIAKKPDGLVNVPLQATAKAPSFIIETAKNGSSDTVQGTGEQFAFGMTQRTALPMVAT